MGKRNVSLGPRSGSNTTANCPRLCTLAGFGRTSVRPFQIDTAKPDANLARITLTFLDLMAQTSAPASYTRRWNSGSVSLVKTRMAPSYTARNLRHKVIWRAVSSTSMMTR